MLVKGFNIGALGTNCYIASGEDFAFAVDPADADKEMLEYASSLCDKPNKAILLTHCHIDHILGLTRLHEIWRCPIIIGEGDMEGIMNPAYNLSTMIFGTDIAFSADKKVADGDKITLGSAEISVLETPGHTPGSVCYIIEDVMFSGDMLFRGTIGRTDFPRSNTADMLSSLKKLVKLEINYRVFPGHNEETTLFYEKKYNPFLRNNEFM